MVLEAKQTLILSTFWSCMYTSVNMKPREEAICIVLLAILLRLACGLHAYSGISLHVSQWYYACACAILPCCICCRPAFPTKIRWLWSSTSLDGNHDVNSSTTLVRAHQVVRELAHACFLRVHSLLCLLCCSQKSVFEQHNIGSTARQIKSMVQLWGRVSINPAAVNWSLFQ